MITESYLKKKDLLKVISNIYIFYKNFVKWSANNQNFAKLTGGTRQIGELDKGEGTIQ